MSNYPRLTKRGLPVEGREHYRHDNLVVFLNQGHYVLIVPEVQCPLSHLDTILDSKGSKWGNFVDLELDLCVHLKVWTGDTLGNLLEKRLLDFDKLRRLNHIQNLLNFTQEHHLMKKKPESGKVKVNSTSFCEHVLGQNFSSPLITLKLNV